MSTVEIEREFSSRLSKLPRGKSAIKEIVDDISVPSQDMDPDRTNSFRCEVLKEVAETIFECPDKEDKEEIDMHQLRQLFEQKAETSEVPERRAIFISIACAIQTVMGDVN